MPSRATKSNNYFCCYNWKSDHYRKENNGNLKEILAKMRQRRLRATLNKKQSREKINIAIAVLEKLMNRAERHDFWSWFFLFILIFFIPLFLWGKRKGEKNNQSRGQNSYLSARSFKWLDSTIIVLHFGGTNNIIVMIQKLWYFIIFN